MSGGYGEGAAGVGAAGESRPRRVIATAPGPGEKGDAVQGRDGRSRPASALPAGCSPREGGERVPSARALGRLSRLIPVAAGNVAPRLPDSPPPDRGSKMPRAGAPVKRAASEGGDGMRSGGKSEVGTREGRLSLRPSEGDGHARRPAGMQRLSSASATRPEEPPDPPRRASLPRRTPLRSPPRTRDRVDGHHEIVSVLSQDGVQPAGAPHLVFRRYRREREPREDFATDHG